MDKYAGVVLDYYDDKGETLKGKFPTLEQVPDPIKTASVRPKEKLANEDFALVAVNGPHVMRKYAMTDPGTTAMSVIYFMEHGDKLPIEAQKHAAANLVDACGRFNLKPPAQLEKLAQPEAKKDLKSLSFDEHLKEHESKETSEEEMEEQRTGKEVHPDATVPGPEPAFKKASVDITGKSAPMKLASLPRSADDYAVVLEGKGYYPIHDWDHIKMAADYWQENRLRMEPELRHQYVTKLASKARQLGYILPSELQDAGSPTYAAPEHLKEALDMRKVAFHRKSEERAFLEDLFEKRAELDPSIYAETLRRFDLETGLAGGWDQAVLDPWSSTFGKEADTVVWEDGLDRVTSSELHNLALNHGEFLRQKYTTDFIEGFLEDPIGFFNALPTPQKKLFARLADNKAHDGSSEAVAITADESPSARKASGAHG